MTLNVNQVAFATSVGLGIACIGSGVAAAAATSTIAKVAFAALAVIAGSANLAAGTAWLHSEKNETTTQYFERFTKYSGIALASVGQVFSTAVIEALVASLKNAIIEGLTGRKVNTVIVA